MIFSQNVMEKAIFPSVIDSTIVLSTACPVKFFYQFALGLAPVQKSIHLHAGGAFAHGVEAVRKNFYLKKMNLEDSLLEGWKEFINYWGDYEAPEGSYKDFYNVSAALFDYFYQYNPNNDHIQPYIKNDGTPAVEFTFALPLPINHPDTGEPLIYAGRCDMLGMYESMGCIVDEKTTYTFPVEWSRMFAMRGQFLGYTWAAQQYGFPISMCVVRGVAIQQRSIKHLEAILQFPQWQVDRWYEEMLRKVQYIVDVWKSKDFPLNYGDICSSYGGCPQLDLCISTDPEVWLPSFATRRWNPLDKAEAST